MPDRPLELREQAILLAYQGEELSWIAERLGLAEAQVGLWLHEIAREPRPDHLPRRQAEPEERRRAAETLLSRRQFITAFPPEGEDDADVLVYFDDLSAQEFYDLVEASVGVLSALPGVESVWHEDRELLLVTGSVDPAAIRGRRATEGGPGTPCIGFPAAGAPTPQAKWGVPARLLPPLSG